MYDEIDAGRTRAGVTSAVIGLLVSGTLDASNPSMPDTVARLVARGVAVLSVSAEAVLASDDAGGVVDGTGGGGMVVCREGGLTGLVVADWSPACEILASQPRTKSTERPFRL